MAEDKKSYIGLTIGPIIETINNAKETGELWASSYLFSYIMKNIIKTLISKDRKKNNNEDQKIENRFILPCIKDIVEDLNNPSTSKEGQEVGLFHDRFIFESQKGDFESVRESIDKVIDDITLEIKNYDRYKNESKEVIKSNIEDFLKIYYLEIDVDLNKVDKDRNKNNIIFKVNRALDALELREKISNDSNYLRTIFRNNTMNKNNNRFLCKDAYGEKGKEKFYPSLFKIALDKVDNKYFPSEDEKIEEKLKKEKGKLIKANEYVAVVQADGDSMGKMINKFEIHNDEADIYKDYKDFSSKLLKYDKKSHKAIKQYGGFTVYAGGDDLLFIAPVIKNKIEDKSKTNNDEKNINNIFELIDKLSQVFDKEVNESKEQGGQDTMANEGKEEKLTTSFGVAIVHHKFPLYYALDEARDLLFNKAKNYKFNGKEKNAIAFKVIKSSGQSFETVVGKETESYNKFKKLFNKVSTNLERKDNTKKANNYLKAIHFKLMRDKGILNKIGKNKVLLQNYFDNNFDEKIHETEPIKTYLNDLIKFINQIYSEMEIDEEKNNDKDKCMDQIYTYLRFIKFMDEDSELNEK